MVEGRFEKVFPVILMLEYGDCQGQKTGAAQIIDLESC